MTLPSLVDFEGIDIRIVDLNGAPWITLNDLARALYGIKGGDQTDTPFARAVRQIRRIFDRSADEFTDDMTRLMGMETPGGIQQVRIFSARGAYLFAMFVKSDSARRFRRWVLDVLEGKALHGHMKNELAERRVRVMELNAATKCFAQLREAGGARAASRNAAAIYEKVGLQIDMSMSIAFDQRELDLVRQPTDDDVKRQMVVECQATFGAKAAQQLAHRLGVRWPLPAKAA